MDEDIGLMLVQNKVFALGVNVSYPLIKDGAGRRTLWDKVLAARTEAMGFLRDGPAESGPSVGIMIVFIAIVVVALMGIIISAESSFSGVPDEELRSRRMRASSDRPVPPARVVGPRTVPSTLQPKFPQRYSGGGTPLGSREANTGGPLLPPASSQEAHPVATLVGDSPIISQNTAAMPNIERVSLTSVASPPAAGTPARSQTSLQASLPASAGRSPPPLCPALVLPHCEAWFAVSFDKLIEAAGEFNILGLSGNPLLRASVTKKEAEETLVLNISMTPARSPTLAKVEASSTGSSDIMTIHGGGGNSFGELQPAGSLQYALVCEGATMLIIALHPGGQMQIHSTIDGTQGSCIARASRCVESGFYSGSEHLEVRVNPGVDAVLILCCVLSLVLFDRMAMPAIAVTSSMGRMSSASGT